MNDIFASIAIYSFLAFPPAILILKFITKKPGWWLIFLLMVLFVILGWGLVFTAFIEEQARIGELIDQERYEELPDGWDSDGASGVFALFGGWLVPLAYFVLWLVIYTPAAMVRSLFTSRQPPNKRMQSDAATPNR
ncbi:hypothetical protein [Allochromatium palmeri]|uniref:Uncharacterized protein n=1 Tax=Allochromatium palmeri TaxID=231048 RepID=A0A6N8E9I1_9GAMM|nr:hypothetical protein [Allochromatium palmeri]MTW20795.1 hypothetical protein [Allochromatium palmeri]